MSFINPNSENREHPSEKKQKGLWIQATLLGSFIILLVSYFLCLEFRGLWSETGMEQAQIAREMSRGNFTTTKVLRPLTWEQARSHQGGGERGIDPLDFPNTLHPPLWPLSSALFLKGVDHQDAIAPGISIYAGDLIVAGVGALWIILSAAAVYGMVSAMFNARIAVFTVFLLLICHLIWKFAMGGLPQPMLLGLFTFVCWSVFKALQQQESEGKAGKYYLLSGILFGVMFLTHPLSIWLWLGMLIYACLFIRDGKLSAILGLSSAILFLLPWLIWCYVAVGDLFGASKFIFQAVFSGQEFDQFVRSPEPGAFLFSGFVKLVMQSFVDNHLSLLYAALGGSLASLLFFPSLLYRFKNPAVAKFQMALLLMWVTAVIGMSLTGMTNRAEDPNQFHILFLPCFTGYGLAFLTVLWRQSSFQGKGIGSMALPMFVIFGVSALPLLANMPTSFIYGLRYTQYRMTDPYFHPTIQIASRNFHSDEVMISDIPAATAWYGDQVSMLLPRELKHQSAISEQMLERGVGIPGMLLSYKTSGLPFRDLFSSSSWKEWSPVTLYHGFRHFGVNPLSGSTFPFKSVFPLMGVTDQYPRGNFLMSLWMTQPRWFENDLLKKTEALKLQNLSIEVAKPVVSESPLPQNESKEESNETEGALNPVEMPSMLQDSPPSILPTEEINLDDIPVAQPLTEEDLEQVAPESSNQQSQE